MPIHLVYSYKYCVYHFFGSSVLYHIYRLFLFFDHLWAGHTTNGFFSYLLNRCDTDDDDDDNTHCLKVVRTNGIHTKIHYVIEN